LKGLQYDFPVMKVMKVTKDSHDAYDSYDTIILLARSKKTEVKEHSHNIVSRKQQRRCYSQTLTDMTFTIYPTNLPVLCLKMLNISTHLEDLIA